MRRRALLAFSVFCAACVPIGVRAQQPASLPAPSPSPSPANGFSVHGLGTSVFFDQATDGPGASPPEGPGFANGNPAAPMSPYDWFAGTPEIPGVSGQLQYAFDLGFRARRLQANATVLVSGFDGSITNSIYWGEPILGPLDPHEGRSPVPYRVVFPTHAGSDDAFAGQLVLPYSASVADADGAWKIAGGFVAPAGYDAFVFTPPALTSWTPGLGVAPLLSAGPGMADLDTWHHQASSLPLLGVDATASPGGMNFEFTDALLPAPSGKGARLLGFASALDRGDAGRFSIDWIDVTTSGSTIGAPVLFGAAPQLHYGPQGALATSTLGDQTATIAGARAFFHPLPGFDATLEYGRSWYESALAVRPGTTQAGNYEHAALARRFDDANVFGVDYYRFDPHYASELLPYGIQENVLGVAWAYPGPWLKGTYQLAYDNVAGSNRVGWRAFASYAPGRLRANAAYYDFRQLYPSTYGNMTQTGFVEVDYLTEAPGDVTLGRTQGVAAYLGWQLPHDTVAVDFTRDTQYRPYSGAAAADGVDMRYPVLVVSDEHRFSSRLLAAAGYGRYGASGVWAGTPVSGIYGLGFAGAQWEFDPGRQAVMLQIRRFGLVGLPSIPGGPPPTVRGTAFVLDHHIAF